MEARRRSGEFELRLRLVRTIRCDHVARIIPSPHGNKRTLRLAQWNSTASPLILSGESDARVLRR